MQGVHKFCVFLFFCVILNFLTQRDLIRCAWLRVVLRIFLRRWWCLPEGRPTELACMPLFLMVWTFLTWRPPYTFYELYFLCFVSVVESLGLWMCRAGELGPKRILTKMCTAGATLQNVHSTWNKLYGHAGYFCRFILQVGITSAIERSWEAVEVKTLVLKNPFGSKLHTSKKLYTKLAIF